MRVSIDLDSVLNDGGNGFIGDWVNIYNKRYDDNLDYKTIINWDIASFFTKCTKQECFDILTPQFFSERIPTKDARLLIYTLKEMGHEITIVTAYGRDSICAKINWIEKHLGLNEDDIMPCNKKYKVEANIVLDDGIHNFMLPDGLENDKIEKILVTQPHNIKNGLTNYYRIHDLMEAVKIIERLDKK